MISEHFSREEFSCGCGCNKSAVDAELLMVLEDVRWHFKSPVTVTSGNRCISHNILVGGVPESRHLICKAADIEVRDVPAIEVYTYLANKYLTKYGIGSYESFTHIDVREIKARW